MYIHCAAGIHRTGIFAYMLQRIFGVNTGEAYENLHAIREHTYKGVGKWRIELAEGFIQNN